MNSAPLISRRRHYFYVLVFSVAAWLLIAGVLGGFIPVRQVNPGWCGCGMHYVYTNFHFTLYLAGSIMGGLLCSYPIHRLLVVSLAKHESTILPFSRISRIGKKLLGWRGIGVIVGAAGIFYAGDTILHKCYPLNLYNPGNLAKKCPLLYCAARNGDMNGVKIALEKNPDLNDKIRLGPGGTALHGAAKGGHGEIVSLLIEKGADVNIKSDYPWEVTPLHEAARSGDAEVVRMLIDNGADVNAQDVSQHTPLHLGIIWGRLETVSLLVDRGADLKVRAQWGQTPFLMAVDRGRVEIARLLIAKGANIKDRMENKSTALDLAAGDGNLKMVELLLEHGAEIDDYALSLAVHFGHKDVIVLLVENGADVNFMSGPRITLLDIAKLGVEGKLSRGYKSGYVTDYDPYIVTFLRAHGGKTGEELREAKK